MNRSELEKYFLKLRFDPSHHLGLGDIRLTLGQQDELLAMCAVPEDVRIKAIIGELAAIADACADLHQNRNRDNGDAIMQWDNAKLTLGTVRKARWLRDSQAKPQDESPK